MNHGAVSLTTSVGKLSANKITCKDEWVNMKRTDCGI